MVTAFLDSEGVMDVDYLHRGMAVGGQYYADLLLTGGRLDN